MDKAAFLVRLQKNIGMLDDDEQKDIMDEYSQHIDMKVAKGMTEAEAIEDFGDFEDFVREVLSAYHVKAPFDQKINIKESAEPATAAGVVAGEVVDGMARAGASAATRLSEATKEGIQWCGEVVSKLCAQVTKTAERDSSNEASASHLSAADAVSADSEHTTLAGLTSCSATVRKTRQGLVAKLMRACWQVIKTGVRWMWNACVVCLGGFVVCGTLFALFACGASAVLLVQGYPALGVTLGAVGVSISGIAVAFLAS